MPVKAVRLDDVLPSRVDLILMDTQASEHVAVRGARRLLERSRPLLLVEFWPQGLREAGTDPVSVLDGYRAMGLRAVGAEGELPADPGELVQAVDAAETPFTTLRLEPVDPPPPATERLLPAGRRLGRTWARRFPATVQPGTLAYDSSHRGLVRSLLDSEDWLPRFASGCATAAGARRRLRRARRRVPVAVLARALRAVSSTPARCSTIGTWSRRCCPRSTASRSSPWRRSPSPSPRSASPTYTSDLRALPLRDDWFDEVVCLSTLEHVGMDNAGYGAAAPRAEDPRAEAAQALRELLRVVRPGGRVHLSVPFGRREDHGWFRQLDRDDVDDLLARAGAGRHEETVFQAHATRLAPQHPASGG